MHVSKQHLLFPDMEVHVTARISPPSKELGEDGPTTPPKSYGMRKRASTSFFTLNGEGGGGEQGNSCQMPHHSERLTADEVEPWQRFPFIERGYRRAGLTAGQSILSLFGPTLHNETLNAWTMILSVVAGIGLFFYYFVLDPTAPSWDSWDATPFYALLLGQVAHAPAAIGYHTFMATTPTTAYQWRRADLCLVLVLNSMATYALAYYTLKWYATLALTATACYCATTGIHSILLLQKGQPLDRKKVITRVAGCTLGYYGVVIYRGVASAVIAGKQAATAEAAALLLAGAGAEATPSSLTSAEDWLEAKALMFWAVLCAVGECLELWTAVGLMVSHGFGAACYILHWPQKHYPRVFDLCGFSHNLMHIFCFAIYVCGYPYLAMLHAKHQGWTDGDTWGLRARS